MKRRRDGENTRKEGAGTSGYRASRERYPSAEFPSSPIRKFA